MNYEMNGRCVTTSLNYISLGETINHRKKLKTAAADPIIRSAACSCQLIFTACRATSCRWQHVVHERDLFTAADYATDPTRLGGCDGVVNQSGRQCQASCLSLSLSLDWTHSQRPSTAQGWIYPGVHQTPDWCNDHF